MLLRIHQHHRIEMQLIERKLKLIRYAIKFKQQIQAIMRSHLLHLIHHINPDSLTSKQIHHAVMIVS